MALRKIVTIGDDMLYKKSRLVDKFNLRLWELIDDMKETMYNANGVGLAAVQIGILKRVVVIDIGEGPVELVNPVITGSSGSVIGQEGCLSVPGKWGEVARPTEVTVKAQDRNGEYFEFTAKDYFARAVCHELDHLEGELFVDKAEMITDASENAE